MPLNVIDEGVYTRTISSNVIHNRKGKNKMSIEELQSVEPVGEPFSALTHSLSTPRQSRHNEIAYLVDTGHLPNVSVAAEEDTYIVAIDADDFYGNRTVGVVGVEDVEDGVAHVKLRAEHKLADDPQDLNAFLTRSVMRRLGVESLVLTGSNLPESTLVDAGATALAGSVEFHAAA
jgi:hypothetical protein